MEKINVAELLCNCPKGMELNCTMYENVTFEEVVGTIDCDGNEDVNIILLTHYNDGTDDAITLTNYGTYTYNETAKCVIFPKGKTTWEGFQRPFKDGDILATDLGSVFFLNMRHNTDEYYGCYVGIGGDSSFHICVPFAYKECCGLATEEEKQKLFEAIKDNGYKWNAETKTLEKLVIPKFKVGDVIQDIDTYKVKITEVSIEDECYEYESMDIKGIGSIGFSEQDNWELVPNKFDINTLVPFESMVLVRNSYNGFWQPTFWGIYEAEKANEHQYRNYLTTKGFFRHCIPYNDDTKHLLGTTDDCDEYYKNW